MTFDSPIYELFFHASLPVQIVISLLISMSLISWAIILERLICLKIHLRKLKQFEQQFWEQDSLVSFFQTIQSKHRHSIVEQLFINAFNEAQDRRGASDMIENVKSTMDICQIRIQAQLDHYALFLASAASTSPYIGIVGTVFGIIHTLNALSTASHQLTLNVVAPGISEALYTTALGLFVAIPALFAYNRIQKLKNEIDDRLTLFQMEFIQLLTKQTNSTL
tara:strand:- start:3818 stop:4483 length:666 start_codon:yes stop_codon:yes gene_type:complete